MGSIVGNSEGEVDGWPLGNPLGVELGDSVGLNVGDNDGNGEISVLGAMPLLLASCKILWRGSRSHFLCTVSTTSRLGVLFPCTFGTKGIVRSKMYDSVAIAGAFIFKNSGQGGSCL